MLGARRLSRYKDNSTSFERQGDAVQNVISDIGGRFVAWADDPDVSAAKVAPMDRPGLGEWLAKPTEFDGIAWQRLDRAVRSMADMADLGRWARTHKKRLIFAEGPGGGRLELDMGSPMSELILMIPAFAAQMEVQATEERVLGATRYLRSVGRWKGGRLVTVLCSTPTLRASWCGRMPTLSIASLSAMFKASPGTLGPLRPIAPKRPSRPAYGRTNVPRGAVYWRHDGATKNAHPASASHGPVRRRSGRDAGREL
ncbi:recombinase family protein [Streptomyces tubercidicus]|uniref:recombinase family protein n=1 Tax=Streptomyces tubercidicus TaxID=47759 RepID=UPI0039906655